jgi:hypothetical protein
VDGTAAYRSHLQAETEFQRDLVGIGGKDGKRTRSDVTETDHTDMNVSHFRLFS